MEPSVLGTKYDKIAQWWHDSQANSGYGVKQLEKALGFCNQPGKALDVGCGAGGRLIHLLQEKGFAITGLDVSQAMIDLAKKYHPDGNFLIQDICTWETQEKFDFILAWDSLFHLPLPMQKPVVSKLCHLLSSGGILIYTFGNAEGEHTDQWCNDTFYYSSIGIHKNLELLIGNSLTILHLELDQYPEKHAYVIAWKPEIADEHA